MFDLFRSREKSVRILLGALLLLVALSMLTYLVPNYNNGSNPSDVVVADVGDETVTLTDVQQSLQGALRGKQLPPELLGTYVPQMVDQLVTAKALAYEARKLGFAVSDSDLRAYIQQVAPGLFPDGKFVGRDAYAAMLAQNNLTIPQFEETARRDILVARLKEVAVEGTIVTPAEIEQAFQEKFERANVQYVKLVSDKYKAEVQPSEPDMRAYYQANIKQYTHAETRDLTLLVADKSKMEAGLNPTDAQLQQLYNQTKDQFRVPERVHALHILFMTQGKPPADDAKIRAQADDVLKQLQHGGDFAALATKYSEDPGSKAKGGDLGWVQRGQMVPEFEKTTFELNPGQISGLVKTQYGYHIIKVLAHDDAHLETLEEAKPALVSNWKSNFVNNEMQRISDQAQTALQKDPQHPDKVADEFKMQAVRANGVGGGAPIPEIGTNSDFEQSIAGLKASQVSPVVALPGDKEVLAVVDAVNPPRPSTFEEVKDQVQSAIVQNRLTMAVQKHAQEVLDKARAMGNDLEKAAKSLGLEVKTTGEFESGGSIVGVGTAAYLQAAFKQPVGSVFGPVPLPDGTLIGRVIARIPPDPGRLASERATVRDQVKGERAQQRDRLFEAGVKQELIRQGKIKYHQAVIQRLIAEYTAS
ncbi:MAG: peptidylprolyl isomerase [Bryobacteraceae bacterium]|jgi:peptidyl-prolyl cis-trans isomerase D